jgi:hypothetical protein
VFSKVRPKQGKKFAVILVGSLTEESSLLSPGSPSMAVGNSVFPSLMPSFTNLVN